MVFVTLQDETAEKLQRVAALHGMTIEGLLESLVHNLRLWEETDPQTQIDGFDWLKERYRELASGRLPPGFVIVGSRNSTDERRGE